MPKISVIVPVYKVEKYINQCIDSILAQTFSDFELILVDDGSPDKCGEICDEYAKKDSRIHVIHQENGGLSAARNTGIDWANANSDSEWITFIDSDDWVHREYLRLLYSDAIALNVNVSSCFMLSVNDNDNIEPEIKIVNATLLQPKSLRYSDGLTWHIICVPAWGKIYKKLLFGEIRFPLGRINEDVFTTYKVIFACNEIAWNSSPLYFYRLSEASIMRSEWTPKRLDAIDGFKEQFDYFIARSHLKAAQISMKTCIEEIYNNIAGAKNSPHDYQKTIDNLRILLKENLSKHGKFAGFNYYNAAVYYKEIYPFFSPIWNLFIFIRIMKTEGMRGIKHRLKERLKCRKSQ